MNVNLEYYKIFRSIVRQGSFSGAAKELFITQPAVSQAVGHLEAQLKTKLFTRTKKGAVLTGEGKILYEHISSALQLISAGEERLDRMNSLQAGELKISSGDTISRHYLLPHLERFHTLYPDIKIKVTNRTSNQALALLKSGLADLAFVNLPVSEEGIEVIEVLEVEDIFIAGQSHSAKTPLTPLELSRMPLIMLEDISVSRQYVNRWFEDQGIQLEPEIELGSHDLLIEFAKIGLGVSCVIREFALESLQSGELVEIPLTRNVPKRQIGLCFLKDVSLSICARRFIQMLNLEAFRNEHKESR